MIQDISPYRYDNAYHPRRPKEEDFLLCYQGKQALLRKQGEEIRFPAFREAQAHWEGEAEKLYEEAVYPFRHHWPGIPLFIFPSEGIPSPP